MYLYQGPYSLYWMVLGGILKGAKGLTCVPPSPSTQSPITEMQGINSNHRITMSNTETLLTPDLPMQSLLNYHHRYPSKKQMTTPNKNYIGRSR